MSDLATHIPDGVSDGSTEPEAQVIATEESQVYDFQDPLLRKAIAEHIGVPAVEAWSTFNRDNYVKNEDGYIERQGGELVVRAVFERTGQRFVKDISIDDTHRPFTDDLITIFGNKAQARAPKDRVLTASDTKIASEWRLTDPT